MKLQLVSHALCPYVHRAAIMLREKNVAFETTYVDLKNKPDWFLAISPRGKVPVLIAEGAPLFESAAICEFLDETHPPRLMPADPFDRARQRGWVEVANDLLVAQYKALAAPESAEAEAAAGVVDALLDRFENAFTTGLIREQEITFLHVAIAPALHRFAVVEHELGVHPFARTPLLAELTRHVVTRPSVAQTVPADFSARFIKTFAERGSFVVSSHARMSAPPGS